MKRLGITGVREISTILCVFCILFVFMTGTQTICRKQQRLRYHPIRMEKERRQRCLFT